MAGGKRAGYKLATYQTKEGPRAGLVIGEEVFDAAKLTGKPAYATVIGILADWKIRRRRAEKGRGRSRQEPGQTPAAGQDQIAGAGALPPTIFCAGANYADHAAAMARKSGHAGAGRSA